MDTPLILLGTTLLLRVCSLLAVYIGGRGLGTWHLVAAVAAAAVLLLQQCVVILCNPTAFQLASGSSTLKTMSRGRLGVVGNAQHAMATTRRDARPIVSLVVAPSLVCGFHTVRGDIDPGTTAFVSALLEL